MSVRALAEQFPAAALLQGERVRDMAKLVVEGLHKLNGEAVIHGAKNSALPILAATILSGDVSEISNCPRLSDVAATQAILRHLGCRVEEGDGRVLVDSSGMCRSDIPDSLMREMRSSIVFLGAIAARTGQAQLSFPGGCELGPRRLICIWRHCAVWDWKLRRNVDGSTAAPADGSEERPSRWNNPAWGQRKIF